MHTRVYLFFTVCRTLLHKMPVVLGSLRIGGNPCERDCVHTHKHAYSNTFDAIIDMQVCTNTVHMYVHTPTVKGTETETDADTYMDTTRTCTCTLM